MADAIFGCAIARNVTREPLQPSSPSQIGTLQRSEGTSRHLRGTLFANQLPDLLDFLVNELFSRGRGSLDDNVKHLLFDSTCAFIKVLH